MSNEFGKPSHNDDKFLRAVLGQIEGYSEAEVVPPIFKLGQAATKNEIIVGDLRALSWELVGNEKDVSKIASWDRFAVNIDEDTNIGTLFLPEATRNAKSVLSGKEAWQGEKSTLVGSVAKYISAVEEQLGGYDVNLAWSSVGITPDQEIFVSPPNLVISIDDVKAESYKSEMTDMLEKLLENDEANRGLVSEFSATIRGS